MHLATRDDRFVNSHFWMTYFLPGIFMLLISSVAVALRFWIRLRIVRSFAANDWWLLVAQLANVSGMILWIVHCRIQSRYPAESTEQYRVVGAMVIVQTAMYILGTLTLKISVALFFLRLAQKPWQRWLYIVSLTQYAICLTIAVFVFLFHCGGNVDPVMIMRDDDCAIGWHVFSPIAALVTISNAVCDIIFALTPLSIIFPRRKTRSVSMYLPCSLIAMAAVGGAVSVGRIATLRGFQFGPGILQRNYGIFLLSFLELSICTTTIALVTFQPLIKICRDLKDRIISRLTGVLPSGRGPSNQIILLEGTCGTFLLDETVLRGIGIIPESLSDVEHGKMKPLDKVPVGVTSTGAYVDVFATREYSIQDSSLFQKESSRWMKPTRSMRNE